MDDNNPIDIRRQLGALIGLGCPECGGYVTVDFQDVHKYQAVCQNCGHKYWITFDKDALQKAAPKLLAACVLLVGTLMRDTPAAQVGSMGHAHVEKALRAISAATGYSHSSWAELTQEIKQVTQEVRQVTSD